VQVDFPSWTRRRAAPVAASAVIVAGACVFVPWWNAVVGAGRGWHVPGDLWGTQMAAWEYVHGHVGAVYSPTTALVTLPGILVVLAPAVALSGALHLSVAHTGVITFPTGWLLVEAASIAAGLPVLFAADGLARRLGVSNGRRFVLAGFEVVGLWNVVVWWGHPEDALALALLLFAVPDVIDGRWARAGWLLGLAFATQPVVVLALAVLVVRYPRREWAALAGRLVLPTALLVAAPLAANWHGTWRALAEQPNFPLVDHTTLWTSLAPVVGPHDVVAAGPFRLASVAAAVVLGVVVGRRGPGLELTLGVMAAGFGLRVLFEPVMVAYYVWPVLAVALVAAANGPRWRLATAGGLATFTTVFGDAKWRGNWSWWAVETVGAVAVCWLSVRVSKDDAPDAVAAPVTRSRSASQAVP
jgi:hypothetical protein